MAWRGAVGQHGARASSRRRHVVHEHSLMPSGRAGSAAWNYGWMRRRPRGSGSRALLAVELTRGLGIESLEHVDALGVDVQHRLGHRHRARQKALIDV